jgi:multidrug resistance efflux pump
MKFNWFYVFIGLLFLSMLFISMRFFQGSGHASVGVAYSKEYKINSEKAALVASVKVVPGQQIKEGDLLVELTSDELEMSIEKLITKISLLKSELQEKNKLLTSEIALIRAQGGVKIEELNTDIAEEEANLRLNREITRAHKLKRDSTADNPVSQRINALINQRARHEEATAIKVRDLIQENSMDQKVLENQIKLLERELQLLQDQKSKLSKYARTDGVVENVYVRTGEQIDAYTSVISVNPVHPSTVVGYQVGRKETLPIGSEVMISSYDRQKNFSKGRVIGYGSVTQLPEILQKSTAVKAFGREIFIEIIEDNQFSSGEKVLIK